MFMFMCMDFRLMLMVSVAFVVVMVPSTLENDGAHHVYHQPDHSHSYRLLKLNVVRIEKSLDRAKYH